jgi:hypothetical protein
MTTCYIVDVFHGLVVALTGVFLRRACSIVRREGIGMPPSVFGIGMRLFAVWFGTTALRPDIFHLRVAISSRDTLLNILLAFTQLC